MRAADALTALRDLRTIRYPVIELADVVWELRENLSAYDAGYLALARRLDVALVTLDGGLPLWRVPSGGCTSLAERSPGLAAAPAR